METTELREVLADGLLHGDRLWLPAGRVTGVEERGPSVLVRTTAFPDGTLVRRGLAVRVEEDSDGDD